MKPYRGGKKIASSHGTLTPAAASIVDAARKMPEVRKIVIGVIKQARAGSPFAKVIEIPAGLKVEVKGNSAVQEIFLYTDQQEFVKNHLDVLRRKTGRDAR